MSIVHSGAAVGVSHNTTLGIAPLRKQGWELTHLLTKTFPAKIFLEGVTEDLELLRNRDIFTIVDV